MGERIFTSEGEKYHDFLLVNYKVIDELQLVLREIVHSPTGAQVIHLECADPENLFCLSFKTLPESSNGAAHMLEHTVLCGSRKFPVKDPFFSMSRRSLNTFMNALTGSDFTCYPAASQVEKDFYNLLEVYIDAVFHPLLKEHSFLQEGHRLEFATADDPESPLQYKGIVYNEMKGAMNSADTRIWQALMETLVPDLPYAYNSGGDPRVIPSLTYEQLIAFHEKYYHPSRCLFFFYGNFPIKRHLDFIEEHALKNVAMVPQLDGIGHQKRMTAPIRKEHYLPVSESQNLETNHTHAFGWLTTFLLEQEELLALTVLDSILMDTDASPLKKVLLKSGLCLHADSLLEGEMTECPYVFLFKGCKREDADALEKLLFDTFRKIAKKGITYDLVEASLHQLELERTEIGGDHSPFGLTLFMRAALNKQHGCAPEHALLTHSMFKSLREKAKDPHFFTPLIEKYILQNSHFARLTFIPNPDLTAKEAQEEEKALEQLKNQLTEKQKAHILDQAKTLADYQKQLEGQKLDCLPKVTLLDVPAETRHFALKKYTRKNLEIFHHPVFTNHLTYATLLFDLPHLDDQELFDLQLFLILWPELGAAGRTYDENLNLIHAHTGGIGAHVSLHVQAQDPKESRPALQLHGKALTHKTDKLFSLFHDFITQPRFDETARIKELLKKLAHSLQNRLPNNAMRYASQISLSGFSAPSYLNHFWYGLSFYSKIQKLVKGLNKELPALQNRLEALKNKLLCTSKPQLVLSCDEKQFDTMDRAGFYGLPDLKTSPFNPWRFEPILQKVPDQALTIASPVAFTAHGFRNIPLLHKEAPALLAATLILENKVLHRRIREQGGAYGAGVQYNPLWGTLYFYAFRDPHIAHTLRTFEDSVIEITKGTFDDQDLEEAKLGIIQSSDTPSSPGQRALVAYIWERDGKTRQVRQDFRDRLLAVDKAQIQQALEHHLLQQINDGVVTTFAGKDLLDKEIPLIKNKKLKIIKLT